MINDYNFLKFFMDFFYNFLDVAKVIWTFLFTTHDIGLKALYIDFLGWQGYLINFSFPLNIFTSIVSGGFLAFLVMYLVKTFIPIA